MYFLLFYYKKSEPEAYETEVAVKDCWRDLMLWIPDGVRVGSRLP